jgi:GTPase Era involved in 16S rRNA processing/predicted nuclease with TOPRIM domain
MTQTFRTKGSNQLSLNDFNHLRNKVAAAVQTIAQDIQELDSFENSSNDHREQSSRSVSTSSKLLLDSRERMLEGIFTIMIVGEFSTGKSTFLNALIKENLLPVAVRPTTATINIIKFSNDRKLRVTFWGKLNEFGNEVEAGNTIEITPEQLPQYATSLTSEADETARRVKLIEVLMPIEYCRNGVEILDTPGLSSTNAHHDKITLEYLPNGNTVIMLLNPGQPLSRSERFYLRLIRRYIHHVIFVVNKINLLEEDDQRIALQYISSELAKEMETSEPLKIYPLNAKLASKGDWVTSRFGDFVNGLESFLTSGDKAKDMIMSPLALAHESIGEVIVRLDSVLAALTFSPSELNKRITEAKYRLAEQDKVRGDLIQHLNSKVSLILDKFDVESSRLSEVHLRSIKDKISQVSKPIDELMRDLEGPMREEVQQLQEAISAFVENELATLVNEASRRFKSVADGIGECYQALGGIPSVSNPELTISLDKQAKQIPGTLLSLGAGFGLGYIAVSLLGGPLGVIAAIAGGNYLGKMMKKKRQQDQLEQLTTHVLTTLRSQFQTSRESTKRALKEHLLKYIHEIDSRLGRMITDLLRLAEHLKSERLQKEEEFKIRKDRYETFRKQFLNARAEVIHQITAIQGGQHDLAPTRT